MGVELNLTDDQRRRIENAKSPEEKVAIIRGSLDVEREIPDEELDAVSGGVTVPATHEEIDQIWDVIQATYECFGADVAAIMAYEYDLIPYIDTRNGNYFETKKKPNGVRAWMHRELDGKNDYLSSRYGL